MSPPRWIRTPADLAALAASLGAASAIAIDTEADSLHHYPGKLCLVQIADDRGRAHLVDPLALATLLPLAPLCADPGILKVFHAADNDLAYFKRLYGFTVVSLFDTALAARFLGVSALGLDALLERYLGTTPVKSRQKDDWSRRPLSPEQETYALNDVVHLVALRGALVEELRAKGRDAWVEEECAALAAQRVPDKAADPEAYLKLKGAKDLAPRSWAVLRELYQAREALALELDRPPFMIVSHEALVALAAKRPHHLDEVLAVPGCSPRVAGRAGRAILDAVARGEAVPDAALPSRRPAPRPHVPAAMRRRADALRAWRSEAARELGLDPGVLFPQRLIDRLATEPPGDLVALEQVEGVRRWRVKLFGLELLKLLAV
ncbi:MAG TPA: HRDC domain-containing protein [Methylomirabilota bacterium]|jgi:ribonuclease D|nr:HRDC domain-containing protein [Methylomirabilota bacterium]